MKRLPQVAKYIHQQPESAMTNFCFVDDDCHINVEIWVEAATEREARKIAWAKLTDEQKDACGCFTCVDEVSV